MMTQQQKRVLFIHHGSIAGGAPLSMLYTMTGLREEGYEVLAALIRPSPELHALYNDAGFRTIETPWIPKFITWSGSEGKTWNPFTWLGVVQAWRNWKPAQAKLLRVLDEEKIDIVHLNSVGLSNPAEVLIQEKRPFVWHVREHGPSRQGKRFRFIQNRLKKAGQVIFLSQAERRSWIGSDGHGTVVHNFIDFSRFDAAISATEYREQLGVSPDKQVILYVGGRKEHKGVYELLRALGALKKSFGDSFVCIMPDSRVEAENPSRVGREMLRLIEENAISKQCILLPFSPDIVSLFAMCDVLVFPATKPHFARPIIEASAMGKPVIASNLPAIDELVREGITGYLTTVGDVEELTESLEKLLRSPDLRKELGRNGIGFARENFEQNAQMEKILNLYKALEQ